MGGVGGVGVRGPLSRGEALLADSGMTSTRERGGEGEGGRGPIVPLFGSVEILHTKGRAALLSPDPSGRSTLENP